MICPKCSKEIVEESSFCGYCGQVIDKKNIEEASAEVDLHTETPQKQEFAVNVNDTDTPETTAKKNQKSKKRIGLKVLLVFSIIAIIAGATLGWLTAKGIVDFSMIIPTDQFQWTDFSEAIVEVENEESLFDEKSDNTIGEKDSNTPTIAEETTFDPNSNVSESR